MTRAKTNPAQAAWTSNAGQFSLSRSCTRFAVDGKAMSGVKVARTSRSTSQGSRPAAFRQRIAACCAEVAGRLVRRREPALVDPRPVHDPLGVEPVGALEVVIADHDVGDVTARPQDPDAEQGLRAGQERGLAIRRGQGATRLLCGSCSCVAIRVSHLAHSIICHGHTDKRCWRGPDSSAGGGRRARSDGLTAGVSPRGGRRSAPAATGDRPTGEDPMLTNGISKVRPSDPLDPLPTSARRS